MTSPRKERAYEKYAWTLLVVAWVSVLFRSVAAILLGGATYSSILEKLTGMTWEETLRTSPGMASVINSLALEGGLFLLGFPILGLAITFRSYRKGERWAWYVLLFLPLWLLAILLNTLKTPGSTGQSILVLFLIIAILGLLLPHRKFFPK